MQVTSTNVREIKKALRAKFPWIAMGATRVCERIDVGAESELNDSFRTINMLDIVGRPSDHYDDWEIEHLQGLRFDDYEGYLAIELMVYEGTVKDPSLWCNCVVLFKWNGRRYEIHPAGVLEDRVVASRLVDKELGR